MRIVTTLLVLTITVPLYAKLPVVQRGATWVEMVQRGDMLQARHFYTMAIDTLRREHGRQHQLVRHIEIARRRLSGKRTHVA